MDAFFILLYLLPVAAGFFLDFLLGDPPWLYHPVRLIGKLITWLERGLRRILPDTPAGMLTGGTILALVVPGLSFLIPFLLLRGAYGINLWAGIVLETLFCYQILATRCLKDETMRVYHHLKRKDLSGARAAVGRVVGRDTAQMDEKAVVLATVETVAENTTDGVVAPLLYLFLGGGALGWCYKAVNTLDSMVGYNNQRYCFFGRPSARLDDIANFLPARLAAGGMLLACILSPFHLANALRIFRRDRYAHSSPNSAQTEAVCAGGLGIQLGGGASYGGVWKSKPVIGDPLREAGPTDIPLANRMLLATSLLCFFVMFLIKAFLLALSIR